MTHEVVLQGYNVKPGSLQLGTFDSYGIEKIHVTADDSWDGLAIVVTFNPPEGDAVEVRVPADGTVDVPPEATTYEGKGTIVFCGVDSGVQRITKTQGYNVITHGPVGGTEPFKPSESLATQVLQAALNAEKNSAEAKDVADGLRNDADSGKFNGKDGAKGDKGETGTTPQLKIGEDNLWQVSYDNGETWVSLGVKATGEAGKDGEDGLTPHIGKNGNWWLGNTDTGISAKGDKGDTGAKGADGVSPTASVTQTDDGAEFTVTDASGTTTATIRNGTDGRDGAPGAPGRDAVVDATLTQDGQAADAKVTGEKISWLKEDTAALKKRQNVLVGSETGNPVSCDDAFAAPLCGLNVYGKSTQDGTPTPDAPVPIVNAGDGGTIVLTLGDGNGKTQTLTLQTPNGLPGIPVTSGGNYTDQNGQQWVCDEIDLERGVKVQRVKVLDIDNASFKLRGSLNSYWYVSRILSDCSLNNTGAKANRALMCQEFPVVSQSDETKYNYPIVAPYGHVDKVELRFRAPEALYATIEDFRQTIVGTKVYYPLATPIETPLTPAEIAAYKAITAYAPDTVVQASDGAGVKLDYQRDVNLVVKNLEDAIASMTTT